MEDVLKILKEIQKEQTAQKQDMKNMEENIKKSINRHLDEKFGQIEEKTSEIEKKIVEQQKFLENIDKQLRKKNIIIFGIEENEHNYDTLQINIIKILNNVMGSSCQKEEIEMVRRLGKKNNKTRPVVVTFTTMGRKIETMKKKRLLINTGISIKEDFPQYVLQKRKELQEEVNHLREQGIKAVLRYDKIVILNKKYVSIDISHEQRSNKRILSESPDPSEIQNQSKISENMKYKQSSKKNKSNNIVTYLRKPNSNSNIESDQNKHIILSKND